MSLFDSIIDETRAKFNLGDKAGVLLSVLLAMMTDKTSGGLTGFLERFDRAGLGGVASSWVNSDANTHISNEQLESTLGSDRIQEIADKTGTDYQTAASATAFMLPHIVDNLTPDGVVPEDDDLLSKAGAYLTGAGAAIGGVSAANTVDRIGTSATNVTEAGRATVSGRMTGVSDAAQTIRGRAETAVENIDNYNDNSPLRWLLPLIVLGFLVAVGFWFCGKSPEPVKAPTTNTNANKPANVASNVNAAVKTVDSGVSITADGGKYMITGVVPDEATRKQIIEALAAQYGAGNVVDGLKVDASAKPFKTGWGDNFVKLLPSLKDWKKGELGFMGSTITASGLPQSAIDQIKSLFGMGWRLPVSIAGEAAASKQANEEALKNLAEARTAQQVVDALNASIILFDTGKSDIKPEYQTLLQKAAEVLKAQPADTTIEVGGHTDNTGDKDANMKLSEARAESVRNALVKLGVSDKMLTAKGYGDTVSKGDNATEEGKFQNRRIEYKVVSGSGSMTKTETANSNTANK